MKSRKLSVRIWQGTFTAITCTSSLTSALAVEIEPAPKAISALLKTTKAFKKTVQVGGKPVSFFYSKAADGKMDKAVFVEHGLYEPSCTHTWAIGFSVATKKVIGIHPIEMSCPHAFPTKSEGYLDQYTGKGPADVSKLDSQINVVAKATGSCKLLTAAVKRSITAVAQADK
jgi:hypothetical protein